MRQLKLVAVAVIALAALAATATAPALAEPGFLSKVNFVGSGTGGSLKGLSGLAIPCDVNILSGVMTTDSHGTVDIHLEHCTAFSFPANSLGDKSGVILAPSTWLLCLIGTAQNAKLEWGLWLEPTNPVHVEIPIASALIIVKGGVIARITPNASSTTKTATFETLEGDSTPTDCFLEKVVKLVNMTAELNENKKPDSSGLAVSVTLEAENKTSKIEIMDS